MLLKNIYNPNNDDIVRASIVDLIPKQILHIDKLNLIGKSDLNKLVDYINNKYNIELLHVVIEESNSDDISLENLIIDTEEINNISIDFLSRFL